MIMDFTLKKYKSLLQTLLHQDYRFQTFEDYLSNRVEGKVVVLRHDVDKKPYNSLAVAEIENALGIKASYYFRIVPQSNDADVIRRIVELGHEIGYHYEDLSLAKGDLDKAIAHFGSSLDYFRQFYPVVTICMHGSPTSKFDNRSIWGLFSYREYGIIGEPYFDIDFSDMFYITDTGRRWDGYKVSVRDKIPKFQDEWTRQNLVFRTTDDIIQALNAAALPDRLMMTTHPQRWTDNRVLWLKEWCFQGMKNVVKGLLIKLKGA